MTTTPLNLIPPKLNSKFENSSKFLFPPFFRAGPNLPFFWQALRHQRVLLQALDPRLQVAVRHRQVVPPLLPLPPPTVEVLRPQPPRRSASQLIRSITKCMKEGRRES